MMFFTLFMPYKQGGSFGFTQVQLQVTSEKLRGRRAVDERGRPECCRSGIRSGRPFARRLGTDRTGHDGRRSKRCYSGRLVEVLRRHEDAAVGACGTILLDKVGD